MSKQLVDPKKTQESLIALKKEIWKDGWEKKSVEEIFYKINSCLFAEYPHYYQN